MTDPDEERVFLSPEDIKELLDQASLVNPQDRTQIAGAVRGVQPRGPALARLEAALLPMENPEALEAAMTLLRHLGPPGGEVLHRLALQGPRSQVKVAALDVLGETAPGRSCFVMASSWDNYSEHVRRTAVQALRDPDASVREAALWALFMLPGEVRRFPEEVRETVADPDPAVRAAALRLIRRDAAVDEAFLSRVVALLSDADAGVRLEAAALLAQERTQAKASVPVLIDLLGSPDPERREAAARALARYGADAVAATQALGSLLASGAGGELKACLEAIGSIGPPAGSLAPRLGDLARRTDDGLDAAFAALSGLGQVAVPVLAQLLDDAREDHRYRAAQTLKQMGPEFAAAIPILERRLLDPVARVRFRVAQALLLVDPGSASRLAEFILTCDEFDQSHFLHYLAEEQVAALPVLKLLAHRVPTPLQAVAQRHIDRIQEGPP